MTAPVKYVATLAILSLVLGAIGPGEWSLDHATGWSLMEDPSKAIWVALVVGVGGTAGYLATFWRPPLKAEQPGG